jgi:hypothetical protein
LDQRDAFCRMTALRRDHAEQMQRIGVIGILRYNGAIP